MSTRNQLTSAFSSGMTPNGSNYADLINSLSHPSDVVNDITTEPTVTDTPLSALQGFNLSEKIDALEALAGTVGQNDAEHPATLLARQNNHDDTHYTKAQADTNVATASNAEASARAALSSTLTAATAAVATDVTALEAWKGANDDFIEDIQALTVDTTNKKITLDTTYDLFVGGSKVDWATPAELTTAQANLQAGINLKADTTHAHSSADLNSYVGYVSIANYAKLTDLAAKANALHTHSASQVSGLDDLFTTPAEVLALITANRAILDETTILDDFYEKDEIDEHFRVQRVRTDQISLFTDGVLTVTGGSLGGLRAEFQADDATTLASAKAYADTEIADVIASAPGALDTLNELAAAMGDDASHVVTITNLITDKQTQIDAATTDRALVRTQYAAADAVIATDVTALETAVGSLSASVVALQAQVGTGTGGGTAIQADLDLLEASVNITVDQKIADLQEQLSACMALLTVVAGTSTSSTFTQMESVTGIESGTLAVAGTQALVTPETLFITGSQSLGSPATAGQTLGGAFTSIAKSSSPFASDTDITTVFKGTSSNNSEQWIIYDDTNDKWIWMWVDPSNSTNIKTIAEQSSTSATVPTTWGSLNSTNFSNLPSETATLVGSAVLPSPATAGQYLGGEFDKVPKSETALASDSDYSSVFIGVASTNSEQMLAYNTNLSRWEWLWVDPDDATNIKLIASESSSNSSVVPSSWSTTYPANFTGIASSLSVSSTQVSPADLVTAAVQNNAANEVLAGGFIAEEKNDTVLASDGDYGDLVFKGTGPSNLNQLIAYNATLVQWEWLFVDPVTSVITTIATQEDTDASHVPSDWAPIDPDGLFPALPTAVAVSVQQDSTSAVVDYLEALRYFTAGYVQQGIAYATSTDASAASMAPAPYVED